MEQLFSMGLTAIGDGVRGGPSACSPGLAGFTLLYNIGLGFSLSICLGWGTSPWPIPESGEVLQLSLPSVDRLRLSSSVEANATSLSKPELMRSCHFDSSASSSGSASVFKIKSIVNTTLFLIYDRLDRAITLIGIYCQT